MTWRDNYAEATQKLSLKGDDDLEWHADRALDLKIATRILFRGMYEGWFRGHKLPDYFNEQDNDAVGARDIINGDVSTIGPKVAGYHDKFMDALSEAEMMQPPKPEPQPGFETVHVNIQASPGVSVSVAVNGEVILAGVG